MPQSSVRVDPQAVDRLRTIKADLQRDFGLSARNEDIASAVLIYVTVPQVAGMLVAFTKSLAPDPVGDGDD
jgi:hypothetical protein